MSHDAARWHCITGYLEPGVSPADQALRELCEETGLPPDEVKSIRPGRILQLPDDTDNVWEVHTFRAETEQRHLILNWEHDTYRWVRPPRLSRFDGQVTWLSNVINAVRQP